MGRIDDCDLQQMPSNITLPLLMTCSLQYSVTVHQSLCVATVTTLCAYLLATLVFNDQPAMSSPMIHLTSHVSKIQHTDINLLLSCMEPMS